MEATCDDFLDAFVSTNGVMPQLSLRTASVLLAAPELSEGGPSEEDEEEGEGGAEAEAEAEASEAPAGGGGGASQPLCTLESLKAELEEIKRALSAKVGLKTVADYEAQRVRRNAQSRQYYAKNKAEIQKRDLERHKKARALAAPAQAQAKIAELEKAINAERVAMEAYIAQAAALGR